MLSCLVVLATTRPAGRNSDKDDGNFKAIISEIATAKAPKAGAGNTGRIQRTAPDSRYGRESAHKTQQDANNRKQHETPEDDLDTVPGTLMSLLTAPLWLRSERGIKRNRYFVWCRQINRIRAHTVERLHKRLAGAQVLHRQCVQSAFPVK